MSHKKIILALDVPNFRCAEALAESMVGEVGVLKVGLELFIAAGRQAVELGARTGHDIFLDLKIHDIPETVERAVHQAVDLGVRFVTVHSQQRDALERASRVTEGTGTTVLAVTVLTSMSDDDLRWLGVSTRASDQAVFLASQAYRSGIRGFVCSPAEVGLLAGACPNSTLVVPGIRPGFASSGRDDQKRTGTPSQAIRDGASFLVVGRPIRDADDKVLAARAIAREIFEVS